MTINFTLFNFWIPNITLLCVSILALLYEFLTLRVRLVPVKCFLENTYFSEMLISGKGKCIQTVWLSRKSFSGKSILVFGSSKHFTENTLRKSFYGKSFPVFVCGSFYGKYEMCYKFKHLHYLDKLVTVQN